MGKDYEVVSKSPAYVLATQDIALKKDQQYTITELFGVRFEGASELPQGLPQASDRLVGVILVPQQARQSLAGVRAIPIEQQVAK